MRKWVDPSELVGTRLTSILVGQHHFELTSEPLLLVLGVDDDCFLEACTTGDGSLKLDRMDVAPGDFEMGQFGSVEFGPPGSGDLLAAHVGCTVTVVEQMRWQHCTVGLVLTTTMGTLVLANVGDELFVSGGRLPDDYRDAELRQIG